MSYTSLTKSSKKQDLPKEVIDLLKAPEVYWASEENAEGAYGGTDEDYDEEYDGEYDEVYDEDYDEEIINEEQVFPPNDQEEGWFFE